MGGYLTPRPLKEKSLASERRPHAFLRNGTSSQAAFFVAF